MSVATAVLQTQLPLIPNFPKWCKRTEVGLEVVSERPLTFEEWSHAFTILDKTKRGHQWQIGDMLNTGEQCFGDDCYQVIDPEEELQREEDSGETYRKYQQVAERVKIGRRRPKLTFGHHQVIAFLESEEEQDYWLDKAETEKLSVHKLRKAMKGTSDEVEPVSDLSVLQDPDVRAWLEADIKYQRENEPNVPLQASFLRNMIHSRIGQSQWQLARTVESDCSIVREAVKELMGSADEVFLWLQHRNYFMSPPDVDDRLDMLVAQGRVKEIEEVGRKAGQKGAMRKVYIAISNPLDEEEDFDAEAD